MTVREESDSDVLVVWDPLVRIFHWSLVLTFFIAYFTDDDTLAIHVWSGYAISLLIIFRIIWGFVGTKHARFSDFVFGPITTLKYVRDALEFRAKRYLGHNPAGGLMVLIMLALLFATVWSGMELLAIENKASRSANIESAPVSKLFIPASSALADEDDHDRERNEDDESDFWEDVHEVQAHMMLALIFLHIAGVVFSSLAHRENLVRAMITGRKKRQIE